MKLNPIINSLLENDAYKFSMGAAFFHQHQNKQARWAFKCRNKDVKFSHEEVEEIKEQIKHYCSLRYTEQELKDLKEKLHWLPMDYIDYLRFWHPREEDIIVSEDAECGLNIHFDGTNLNVSPYETPVMAIITETHYRMSGHYDEMFEEFKQNVENELSKITEEEVYKLGTFSEFGFRRRLSGEAQDYFLKRFTEEKAKHKSGAIQGFVGTSNVYYAIKYNTVAVGTMAHEFGLLCGQGYPERNPAYTNKFLLESWVKEYGIKNGIALTDTIGTPAFLLDFNEYYATVFSGVRHDSGDPYEWGERMIKHYESLGINPKTKTLLFSDSLDLERADKLYRHFGERVKVAFGIGTALVGPVHNALNIVIKPVQYDGRDVAKLSDVEGKNMCESPEYIAYLKRAVEWRLTH